MTTIPHVQVVMVQLRPLTTGPLLPWRPLRQHLPFPRVPQHIQRPFSAEQAALGLHHLAWGVQTRLQCMSVGVCIGDTVGDTRTYSVVMRAHKTCWACGANRNKLKWNRP